MLDFINTPARPAKKRNAGITSLLDKGIGLNLLDDLLSTAAQYVDLVKFAFGTAVVMDLGIVTEKIKRLNENNCDFCLGGTLFEVVEKQGSFKNYLKACRELGLTCMEISDGAIPISYDRKLDCIREAADFGFKVLSEVGHKNPIIDRSFTVEDRVKMIQKEIEAGSWKVIIEARESGTVGIFDAQGQINEEDFLSLITEIKPEDLIFEAPQKAQQAWLINKLGANVNLGNIAPQDVISLEALRQQLRADTICHD